MALRLLLSAVVTSLCVAIHAVGSMLAFRRLDRAPALDGARFWASTWLLVRIAGWLVSLHLLDILLWGLWYAGARALPDLSSSLYFSSVTYTTVGYGDVVLPRGWRLVGGIEALTGILMCGWSTGFFFAVVTRMHNARRDAAGASRLAG
jgi:hypothetical protein